ncbi:GILT-like protein 1 [Leguminivora glycinivorella]|uniref:GILT-like protein 1 n=1 Tax=Leguminivora glycinivorella TaxID=1035111 RepID=UPI00200BA2F1|nr:GILT-like protein 1 [Leguminivora glycinivorella]
MAVIYSLLALSLLALANAQLQVVNGKIKITTVTTAGCGDTVNFITNQLEDAYEEYKEFLDIEFVPWGRTVQNADGTQTCQFGPNDCFANRLHRCVLDQLKDNQQAQMDYMHCEFSPPRPAYLQRSYACAAAAGLNLVTIDVCVATPVGQPLDAAAQAAAAEPMTIINFVPSIVFNDQIDVSLHTEARTRLKSMICFALAELPESGVTNCQI